MRHERRRLDPADPSHCARALKSSAASCSTGPIAPRRSVICITTKTRQDGFSKSRSARARTGAPCALLATVLEHGQEGRAVWLRAAATFDRGVGLSQTTGRVTHHIAPDIDADRDLLTADQKAAKVVQTIYEVTGIGRPSPAPQRRRRPYYTDGEIKISVLVAGCNQHSTAVAVLDNPPLVTFKNLAWIDRQNDIVGGNSRIEVKCKAAALTDCYDSAAIKCVTLGFAG